MSLPIDVDKVRAVLLADGWHKVEGGSFNLDSYEFFHGDRRIHGGGEPGVCSVGFIFQSGAGILAGPLAAILAVRLNDPDQTERAARTAGRRVYRGRTP